MKSQLDLLAMTAQGIAAQVQSEAISAVDVTKAALNRITKLNGRYNAFIHVASDSALAEAREVDRAIRSGKQMPMAGVPLAVKDSFTTQGAPTTNGSPGTDRFSMDQDAEAIARLRKAGAILVGKASMHEFAYGFTGENPHYGDARNPWETTKIPGGSSSGCGIALATGMALAGVGGDTGGSVRLPAALCGIVGLKVTYGRVSRHGGIPLSWTMDTVGPMTRSVADAALMLNVMAGPDPKDPTTTAAPPLPDTLISESTDLTGIRIGIPADHFFDLAEPMVAGAVQSAVEVLRGLGATVIEVPFPRVDLARAAHRAIIFPEAARAHESIARDNNSAIGQEVRGSLLAGLFVSGDHYLKAQQARRLVLGSYAKVWESIDVLATPTSPITATPIGDRTLKVNGQEIPLVYLYLDHTMQFNLTGQPALSVPCGFSDQGLPIGLQLVGRHWEEATLLRVGGAYESSTHWTETRPPGI